MPAVEASKYVPHLKFLASMVILLKPAQETDFSFVHHVLSSTQFLYFNTYNTRRCREAVQYLKYKDSFYRLPVTI